jgi:PhoPQ-activated pathogenicity-related protein
MSWFRPGPRRPLSLAFLWCALCAAQEFTALDRYVQTPDPAFRFELVKTLPGQGFTTFILDMVSQNWLTPAEVDRTEWRHWLTVMKPEKVTSPIGLLMISGGSNGSKPPGGPNLMLLAMARETGAVSAELRMVPNQPIAFTSDGQPRREDSLIAYTWDRFLRTGEEKWPARLPMTKAAVRAMDAVSAFLKSPEGGGVTVDRFVVAGGSKRGWTTWTTAAVDRRVIAIMPAVIDTLNTEKAMIHHWRAYGFWAPAVKDYSDFRIMDWSGSPQMRALMAIEDPYSYRDRLTLPKYIVNAAGDEFFPLESSQFYFADLPGEKYLRYVPNANHSLSDTDVPFSLLAYFQAIVTNTPRPRFWWKADREAGSIRLHTLDTPSQVLLWQATNPKARDFRLVTIGKAWTSTPVTGDHGLYVASVPKPPEGWTAFFLELTYPSGGKYPFKFTTDVVVTPNRYAFPAPAARKPL